MALADGLRAGDQPHRSIVLEPNVDIFRRVAAGRLDVTGKTQAAEEPAGFAVAAASGEAWQIGALDRFVERFRERAAVHRVAQSVGHRRARHVEPAQRRAIETTLSRGRIDQAFDHIDRFGESGTSGDADRRGVAHHRADAQFDGGNIVDATLQMRILKRLQRTGAAAHIGADVRDTVGSQAQKPALGVQRQRCVREMIAGLMIGDEHLAPAGDPFHRTATAAGGPRKQGVLGVGEVLGAEPATDVGCDEAQTFGGHIQHARDGVAIAVQALAGDMRDILFCNRIVVADDATRLHRIGDDPVVMQS